MIWNKDYETVPSAMSYATEQQKEQIKKALVGALRPDDIAAEHKGGKYLWSVSKTESTEIDKSALEADGLLDKYSKKKETYRINTKAI